MGPTTEITRTMELIITGIKRQAERLMHECDEKNLYPIYSIISELKECSNLLHKESHKNAEKQDIT